MALLAFLDKRYSDAAIRFHEDAAAESDLKVKAALLVNAAASEAGLELFRKCIKTCDAAIAANPHFVRAYLVKGRAHAKVGQATKAAKAWRAGLALVGDLPSAADADALAAMQSELSPPREAISPPTPPAPPAKGARSAELPAAAAAAMGLSGGGEANALEPTDPLRMEAIAAPVAAAAVAAAESAARSAGMRTDSPALSVSPPMLAAARSVLSHSSGVASLDNAIARGYLFVNSGAYGAGLALFDVLLARFPGLVAAHMGKGSACAMTGQYADAVECFTEALSMDPMLHDAWKRRGQESSP